MPIFAIMERIAVFPGTFDPVTLGHHDIIERASELFDLLYLAVGENSTKNSLLPFEQRTNLLEKIYGGRGKIKVCSYQELTVNLCTALKAKYIIRGLRSATDFDYERNIAEMNHQLNAEVETVFLISRPEFAAINSSIVREIWKNGGDISKFVHPEILQTLRG